MSKSIILSFCDLSNDRLEHTVEIQEQEISIFKLFEINNALSLKRKEFIPYLVVGQFHIEIKNGAKILETLTQFDDAKLDEIKILEDDKVIQSYSVVLNKNFEMFVSDSDLIMRQFK